MDEIKIEEELENDLLADQNTTDAEIDKRNKKLFELLRETNRDLEK